MFDLVKYATLAVHLQMRAKKLREDPPDTVEEYAALIEEIKSLSDQLLGQRKAPDFDTAALRAGRDADLAGYMKTDADLDNLPPLEDSGEGDPAFPYSPDIINRATLNDAFAKKRMKRGAEIFGDGKSIDTSTRFTVWVRGGLGPDPRTRNWGEPLDTVK